MRFFEERSQQEIGAELGVTQMQVSRLLQRIMRDLRHELQGEGNPPTHEPDRPAVTACSAAS